MGVDARWEDEQGTALETLEDGNNFVAQLLPTGADVDFPCLRSVDLYSDTVFNQLQLPQLIDELRLLDTRQFDPAVKQHLVSLIRLVHRASGRVHTYIRLYGD
ncbi:MAG: hypothetical protein DMF06_05885 [Verrucomicrobia bacterium]|nr:MAG: hypothetical protein DMF06_05885 [Verrucomicrobiota bacterium]